MPQRIGWHLQERCKGHGNTVGICRNAASATEIRLAFAGMLQMPQRIGWPLQERCKPHGNTIGLCRNAASTVFFDLTPEGLPAKSIRTENA